MGGAVFSRLVSRVRARSSTMAEREADSMRSSRLVRRESSQEGRARTTRTVPDPSAICQGSIGGGWTFYVKDSRLHYAHNYVSRSVSRVSGTDRLPAGRHRLRFEFEPTGKPDIAQGKGTPGMAQLYVDGRLIAQNEFPLTTPIAFNPGGLTCGANPGSAVTTDYLAPFRFTGTLHTVIIDLSGDLITDTASEMRMAMSRQ